MKIKRVLLLLLFSAFLFLVGCAIAPVSFYKVYFYDGDQLITSQSYQEGTTIKLPAEPVKEGYKFLGWDGDGDGVADEITKCTKEVSYYAVYDVKFHIIFKNGDTIISDKLYDRNEMPTVPSDPTNADPNMGFAGWDVNNDGVRDDVVVATSDATYVALFNDTTRYYNVSFYLGDELLSKEEYKFNSKVNSYTAQTKAKTAEFSYEFAGWDANNDGTPETFPFTVTGEHNFVAVFNEIKNKYEYKLYDGATLLTSGKIDYGTKFEYTGQKVKEVDGVYYYLIGFDKDNDGNVDDETITCDITYQAVYSDTQLVIMHYDEEVYVVYAEAGAAFELENPVTLSSYKCVWYLDNTFETPYVRGKMITGNLELYGRAEPTYVIDDKILTTDAKTIVSSLDELKDLFNYLVFNRAYNYTVALDFEVDFDTLTDSLCDACTVDVAYQVGTTYSPATKQLTLNFSYREVNYTNTKSLYESNSIPYYTQHTSINMNDHVRTRSETYNDFFIESVSKTYNVSDSEQLYYVLEHGYRPIIDSKNTDLRNLYNKMKDVLKEIIDDGMTDYEKALAIYEWLIMNVTYDRVVYMLSGDSDAVTQFHSFYLEGVFNDKLAVCDGISKAFVCLANIEGIPCVRVTGTGDVNHAWNKICINNNWYVVDATSGGTIINSSYEILTHNFFLVTDEYFANYYHEDGRYYPEFKATGEYDYYQNFGYRYNDVDYKFYCATVNDLANLLKYYNSITGTNITLDVELGFDYGASISDELTDAQKAAKISGSFTYTTDGAILLLIG